MESATSLIVILLSLVAATAIIGAWGLAIRERRRLRELVAWIAARHGVRWEALPKVTQRLNMAGAVELLRRQDLGDDPEFMDRYRAVKHGKSWQVILQVVGAALIGGIMLGVHYLDWNW